MKKLSITLIFAFVIGFIGCGDKVKEIKDAAEGVSKLAEAGKTMEANAEKAKAKREERVKKGDTLAIDYNKLYEFIPESISGYKAEGKEGQMLEMGDVSYSSAMQKYTKEGASESAEVSIIDYNATYELFQSSLDLVTMFEIDDNQKTQKKFDIGVADVTAVESYDKQTKEANIIIGVGWRFYISIRVENQANCNLAKDIAKNMNLKALATM